MTLGVLIVLLIGMSCPWLVLLASVFAVAFVIHGRRPIPISGLPELYERPNEVPTDPGVR